MDPLMSLLGLRQYAKKTYDQDFTLQEAFVDAFENGAYHEDGMNWSRVAEQVSDDTLVHVAKFSIRLLISGEPDTREGEELKLLMDWYDAVQRWQENRAPENILQITDSVRELVVKYCRRHRGIGWWTGFLREFSIFDLGVRRRMRMDTLELERKYERWIEEVAQAVK